VLPSTQGRHVHLENFGVLHLKVRQMPQNLQAESKDLFVLAHGIRSDGDPTVLLDEGDVDDGGQGVLLSDPASSAAAKAVAANSRSSSGVKSTDRPRFSEINMTLIR